MLFKDHDVTALPLLHISRHIPPFV
jgi:hypothetical protein